MSSLINGKDVIVVQYVESSISNQLLGKFPDNSAFDFDYSQSALWSPPIRRFHHHLFHGGGLIRMTPTSLSSAERRLSFENERRKKKVTLSKIKRKILQNRRLQLDGNNDTGSDSPPAIKKGWEKVLKITSKQFKRTKKKEQAVRVKI